MPDIKSMFELAGDLDSNRLRFIVVDMDENTTVVFHGFLNLSGKEKLKLVESINEYFDSNDREPIRETNEKAIALIDWATAQKLCKCCNR